MAKINKYMFRGYDIRGVVGRDLTPATVTLIAKAYGTFLVRRRIYDSVIGYDCRASSEKFCGIFSRALASSSARASASDLPFISARVCAKKFDSSTQC